MRSSASEAVSLSNRMGQFKGSPECSILLFYENGCPYYIFTIDCENGRKLIRKF